MCAQRVQLKTTIDGAQVPLNPYTDCVKNVRQQMPFAGSKLLGTTVLYVGPQTDKYDTGMCYTCKATESNSYYWEKVQTDGDVDLSVLPTEIQFKDAENDPHATLSVAVSGFAFRITDVPDGGNFEIGTDGIEIKDTRAGDLKIGNYYDDPRMTVSAQSNQAYLSLNVGAAAYSTQGINTNPSISIYGNEHDSDNAGSIHLCPMHTTEDISDTHPQLTITQDGAFWCSDKLATEVKVQQMLDNAGGSAARSIFDIFYSMSSKAPAGAMDLSLGTLITSCDTVFPDFWGECLQRRGNAHMFPQFNGNFYYYWSGANVIGYQGIDGFDGNAVCYYNGKIYVLAGGECDGHYTPPPQSQEWRQFVVPTEQWDAQRQYSIGDTVLYNGQIWCARSKYVSAGYWQGIGIAPGTTDANGYHHWALYDLPTQIVAPSIRTLTESEWQAEVTANGSCGAFVVDEEAKSVRLPKITNMVQPGDVGVFTEAGLPNIIGSFGGSDGIYPGSFSSGAFTVSGSGASLTNSSNSYNNTVTFNAAKSNSIYGNSTTVQPPAVGAKLYIQVFTSAVPASMAQAGEFINMLESYLPLSGGTLTGQIEFNTAFDIRNTSGDNTRTTYIRSSSDANHGAYLALRGKDVANSGGSFAIVAANGTNSVYFAGHPDGKLTWDGQSVLNPIGTVIAFAGNAAPAGYLICNGAAISRTTYAKLFAIIGTTYGTGNGSTTFNLPNLTDKFIMGSGTAGTSKAAGLPNITGGFTTKVPSNHVNYTVGAFAGGNGTSTSNTTTEASYSGSGNSTWKDAYRYGFTLNASKSSSIYGNSTTVQPPALTMRFYIKY